MKLILTLMFLLPALSFAGNIPLPQDGQTLIFAGQNNADSDNFVKINNKIPYGFMVYTALSNLDGLDENADFGAGITNAKHILETYPHTALQIGLNLVGSLEAVIGGDLDNNINKFALWVKKAKVPVYLRIGYEFDFPDNAYEPELYAKAYRKIVDAFKENEVNNVAFVWHSYAMSNPKGIEAWYPGDEYVDWCAISYFSAPQWIPMVNFAKRHSKPLMIAECAPMNALGLTDADKMKWFKTLFSFIEKQNVKALCYINADWNAQPMFAQNNWGDSRLNSTPEIKDFWLSQMQNERFVFKARD